MFKDGNGFTDLSETASITVCNRFSMANFEEFSTTITARESAVEKKSALAIFCRAPRLGSVKTRLAQTHGAEFALQLYCAMLADCFDLGRALAPEIETFACFTPGDAFENRALDFLWNGPRLAQCEGDLGAKILDCFAQLRARGFEKICVIGSDSPDLPPEFLQESFAALRVHDFAFGPSCDGGFYAMSAKSEFSAEIFRDVMWSSSTTLSQIEINLRRISQPLKGSANWLRLPSWRDVDDAEDLQDLEHRLFRSRADVDVGAPRTRDFLKSYKK